MTIFKKQLDSNSYGKWKQNGDFGDTQSQKMQKKNKNNYLPTPGRKSEGSKIMVTGKNFKKIELNFHRTSPNKNLF